MVRITVSAEQIRNAPPEVRRWLQQQLIASLGLEEPAAEARSPHLVACSVDEAAQVLSLLQGVLPTTNVFFELAREGASVGMRGLEAFRLVDMMQHARLQNLDQLFRCLEAINEAFRRVRGDPDAMLCWLDDRGYCLIAEQTQRSILQTWQHIVSAPERAPTSAPVSVGTRHGVVPAGIFRRVGSHARG